MPSADSWPNDPERFSETVRQTEQEQKNLHPQVSLPFLSG
jgi:hypothetical protein